MQVLLNKEKNFSTPLKRPSNLGNTTGFSFFVCKLEELDESLGGDLTWVLGESFFGEKGVELVERGDKGVAS